MWFCLIYIFLGEATTFADTNAGMVGPKGRKMTAETMEVDGISLLVQGEDTAAEDMTAADTAGLEEGEALDGEAELDRLVGFSFF